MQTVTAKTMPPAGLNKTGWPWMKSDGSTLYPADISWPKISIVTPSFNQGKYIEETIRSVLLQNYPNLEYIIIDGGSTDETVEVIKKYEPWLTYWVSEPDRGQSHAINKGLEKCTGEIFNWLNSDDWYMPDTFFEVATRFAKNKALKFVSGYENQIQLDGTVTIYTGTFIKQSLVETIEFCEVAQPSTFFKLADIRKIGGVNSDLHFIMDGDMWVRLLLLNGQQHFLKIEKPLVNFRLHENSKTVSNAVVNNFLRERSSIIAHLQRFVTVPEKVVHYFIEEIYQTPEVLPLHKSWHFNESIISHRRLRLYFIKKYTMQQFRLGKISDAKWGVIELIKTASFDVYLLKAILKLLINKKY
jgi:glycosyltransferase involved in cell wall biosynthesis